MNDEIIQEVWKAKYTISGRYGHNVRSLVDHLRTEEMASSARIVDLHARRHTDRQERMESSPRHATRYSSKV